jgi:hypothetical protein
VLTSISAARVVPTIPQRWAAKGPAENSVLFIRDQLGPQDLIIIDSPYDAAVWYYSMLYGIPLDRFDKRRPFEHLFAIVSARDGQTLLSVMADRGPEASTISLDARRIESFQNLDIYEVPHK